MAKPLEHLRRDLSYLVTATCRSCKRGGTLSGPVYVLMLRSLPFTRLLPLPRILQPHSVIIDCFDIISHEPREERAMTRPISDRTAGSASVARRARLAGPLERRIEELAREERAAVAGGDWTAATSKALERAALREAQHRTGARRQA